MPVHTVFSVGTLLGRQLAQVCYYCSTLIEGSNNLHTILRNSIKTKLLTDSDGLGPDSGE